MKKILILLLISFLLTFCVSEKYKFDKTEFTIKKVEIDKLPNMNLYFKCFFDGRSLGDNRTLINNIDLSCNEQSFSIKNISKYTPSDLKIYYITNYFSENSILEYGSQLDNIHPNYEIYMNDETAITNVDINNTGILNLESYWNRTGDIFAHSRSFLNSFNEKFSYKLFILFLSRNTRINLRNDKEYLDDIRKIIKSHPNWGIGIFYEKGFERQIRELQAIIPNQCFFIQKFVDIIHKTAKLQRKNISKAVHLMNNSNYIINFAFNDIKNPRKSFYDISLSSRYNNMLLNDSFTWEPDMGLIRNYYINDIKKSVSGFKTNNNFPALLDVYNKEYKFTKFDEFYKMAKENINGWLTNIIEKIEKDSENKIAFSDGLKAVEIADNVWEMNNSIYLELKEKFLIFYANYQKNKNYDFNERIKIYNEILEVNPNNLSIKFDLNECQADKSISNNNFPAGLEYLQNAVDIDSNARIRNKLKKNLDIIILRYYKNKEFRNLNRIATKYQSYIKDDFENKIYWAKATKVLHKSADSINLYKWLLNNWRDNNIISWNQLLQNMFDVYAENMKFQEAYELIKQVCMDINEKEPEKAPDLLDAIVYLRGLYINPFIEISRLYFLNNPNANLNKLADSYSRADLPEYFDNIYILSSNKRLMKIIYGSPKELIIPQHYSSYSKKYINSNNKNWYIQPIQNGYFVLQTNNVLTPSEDIRYDEFQKNFSDPNIWFKEKKFFTQNTRNTMIKLITIMLGNEIVQKGRINLNAYENVLNDIPKFKYFVIQNSNESIIYNVNFDSNNAFYKNGGWESSSASPLFYKQEIEYGFQKKEVLDITYPYFRNQNWIGIMRYGFEL